MCDECGKVMRSDTYTRHARVHKAKDGLSDGTRGTHLQKYGDICNPSAPIRTSNKERNIEIVVKTVVNSLVNTVVGILDGDGEILDNDDNEQDRRRSRDLKGLLAV